GNRANVRMGQQPVTQRTRTSTVNLFAKRVRHHNGHAYESNEPCEPTQRQPRAGEHPVESVSHEPPRDRERCENRDCGSTDMPCARQWIALVNVAADGVCLIAKDKLLSRPNLTEVFDGIDAHQRSGRTILFTRIRFAP